MPLVLQTRQSVKVGHHDLTSMAMDRATREIVHAVRHVAPQAEIQTRVKSVQSTLDKAARHGRKSHPGFDRSPSDRTPRRRVLPDSAAAPRPLRSAWKRVRRLHLDPESQRLSIHSHHAPHRWIPLGRSTSENTGNARFCAGGRRCARLVQARNRENGSLTRRHRMPRRERFHPSLLDLNWLFWVPKGVREVPH